MHTRNTSRQKLVSCIRACEQFKQTASASDLAVGSARRCWHCMARRRCERTSLLCSVRMSVQLQSLSAAVSVQDSHATRVVDEKEEYCPSPVQTPFGESGRFTSFSGITSGEFSHLMLSSSNPWLSVSYFDHNPISVSLVTSRLLVARSSWRTCCRELEFEISGGTRSMQ